MGSPLGVVGSLSKASNYIKFEWLINLSDEILETERYLESPTFSFSHGSWCVRMYPKSYMLDSAEYISLFLWKKETQSDIYVEYSLEMTCQDIKLAKHNSKHNFEKAANGWGYQKYLLRSVLLDQWSNKTEECSQLTIKIRMNDYVPPKDTLREREKEGQKIMHQNFIDLLQNDKGRDLILKVKDKEFKVHQNIMQHRSPVFKSMLDHDMLEKNEGVVEIPDCDSIAFENFLTYVYTGQFQQLDESVMLGLYYIADKYEMPCLKEICCEHIKKSLSTHNIGDVIKLAMSHNDSSLLECGKKYFIDNVKKILVCKEWQSLLKENPNLANELFINWN